MGHGKHRLAEYNKENCDFHLYFIFAQEYSKMCSFTADRIFLFVYFISSINTGAMA